MDGSEYLLTCAEVAATLAGFSALVVALRGAESSQVDATSRALVKTLMERSLFAVFFALAPVLLTGLEVGTSALWFVCSGALAGYIVSLAWRSAADRRANPELSVFVGGPTFGMLLALGVGVLALQIAHAFGAGLQQSVWWYLVGLSWLLVSVAYLFFLSVRHWARVG